uniref:Putative secreted peptide n=1 Tax=Anopheles braziliensis TaxID=58242 RepID=A0A2M3ZRM6_9DIPT
MVRIVENVLLAVQPVVAQVAVLAHLLDHPDFFVHGHQLGQPLPDRRLLLGADVLQLVPRWHQLRLLLRVS